MLTAPLTNAPAHKPPRRCSSSLTAQVIELQRRLEVVEAPPAPSRKVADLHEELKGRDAREDQSRGRLVYVVDPALAIEVEQLREEAANRERLIAEFEGGKSVRIFRHGVAVRGGSSRP